MKHARLLPLLVLAAAAALAPWLSPHSPSAVRTTEILAAPSAAFPLGTDALGRCLASRLLHGAQLSLALVLGVTAFSLTAGTLIGAAAGWLGGWPARLLRFVIGVAMAFPALVLGLAVAGVLGPGLWAVFAALSATGWVRFARVAEAVTRSTRQRPFVEAAIVAGMSSRSLLRRHLWPELAGPLVALAAYGCGTVMLHAAALSYLGLGVMPPQAEWGAMLHSSRLYFQIAPRLALAPGLAIWFAVASFYWAGAYARQRFGAALPGGWEQL
jgi:ABC-type dipeptide/oligopeptide/nickel transport system permease subunit